MMRVSSPAMSAFAAALFIILSGVVSVFTYTGVFVKPIDRDVANQTARRSFEEEAMEELWRWRRASFPLFLATDALLLIASLLIVHVAMALKQVFSKTPGLSPKIMLWFFVAGAILPIFEFLQNLGSTGMADVIAGWEEFPEELLGTLEIAFLISQARGLWIYSLQFVFMGLAFGMVSFLTFRYHNLPTVHAIIGLVCSALSFLVFIFELVAFQDLQTFGAALGITFGIWSLLVVPVYLIGTGIALKNFNPAMYKAQAQAAALARKGGAAEHSDDATEMSTQSEEEEKEQAKPKRSRRRKASAKKDTVQLSEESS